MRWIALLFKVAVAGAAGAFLAVSVAGAKPPRQAPDPRTVQEIPVTPDRAKELTKLRNTPPGSPAPSPTSPRPETSPAPRATHTTQPRPPGADPSPHLSRSHSPVSTGPGPAEGDLPVDETEEGDDTPIDDKAAEAEDEPPGTDSRVPAERSRH